MDFSLIEGNKLLLGGLTSIYILIFFIYLKLRIELCRCILLKKFKKNSYAHNPDVSPLSTSNAKWATNISYSIVLARGDDLSDWIQLLLWNFNTDKKKM